MGHLARRHVSAPSAVSLPPYPGGARPLGVALPHLCFNARLGPRLVLIAHVTAPRGDPAASSAGAWARAIEETVSRRFDSSLGYVLCSTPQGSRNTVKARQGTSVTQYPRRLATLAFFVSFPRK